jgi:hypothetical protein
MGNGLKVASFNSNGSRVTPLLYKSNLPSTEHTQSRHILIVQTWMMLQEYCEDHKKMEYLLHNTFKNQSIQHFLNQKTKSKNFTKVFSTKSFRPYLAAAHGER